MFCVNFGSAKHRKIDTRLICQATHKCIIILNRFTVKTGCPPLAFPDFACNANIRSNHVRHAAATVIGAMTAETTAEMTGAMTAEMTDGIVINNILTSG